MSAVDDASGRTTAGAGARRLVIVADNPLIVAAIRSGMRQSRAFELIGYVAPRAATAQRIAEVNPQLVLVDEGDGSPLTVALIRSLKQLDASIHVIVLTHHIRGEWLAQTLQAGANGAVSKAIHPIALATLVREAVCGRIVHAPPRLFSTDRAPVAAVKPQESLTGRELEILQLVASGATNGEIADRLWITQQTVKFHVSNLYRKLDVANRTEACHYAYVNGLVESGEPTAAPPASDRVLAFAS